MLLFLLFSLVGSVSGVSFVGYLIFPPLVACFVINATITALGGTAKNVMLLPFFSSFPFGGDSFANDQPPLMLGARVAGKAELFLEVAKRACVRGGALGGGLQQFFPLLVVVVVVVVVVIVVVIAVAVAAAAAAGGRGG